MNTEHPVPASGPIVFAYDGSELAKLAIDEAGGSSRRGATPSSSPCGNRSTSGSCPRRAAVRRGRDRRRTQGGRADRRRGGFTRRGRRLPGAKHGNRSVANLEGNHRRSPTIATRA